MAAGGQFFFSNESKEEERKKKRKVFTRKNDSNFTRDAFQVSDERIKSNESKPIHFAAQRSCHFHIAPAAACCWPPDASS
jgi:hypothetical protein